MQLLISVVRLDEVPLVLNAGVDILDAKNPREGSIGAPSLRLLRSAAELAAPRGVVVSAALGDLGFLPGTAALAAWGAAAAGARYVKAGLHGVANAAQAVHLMRMVVDAVRSHAGEVRAVAAGYADFARLGGLPPRTVLDAASQAGCDVAMLDTAIKDGATLLDAMSLESLKQFVGEAHERGLCAALAGSLTARQVVMLQDIGTDIVGVRGAVCRDRRRDGQLCGDLLQRLQHEIGAGPRSKVAPPSRLGAY